MTSRAPVKGAAPNNRLEAGARKTRAAKPAC